MRSCIRSASMSARMATMPESAGGEPTVRSATTPTPRGGICGAMPSFCSRSEMKCVVSISSPLGSGLVCRKRRSVIQSVWRSSAIRSSSASNGITRYTSDGATRQPVSSFSRIVTLVSVFNPPDHAGDILAETPSNTSTMCKRVVSMSATRLRVVLVCRVCRNPRRPIVSVVQTL